MPKQHGGRKQTESHPIAGPEAFKDLGSVDHVRSQAATLLLIGSHLRGDLVALRARAEASRTTLGDTVTRTTDPVPAHDIQTLGFPSLAISTARLRPQHLNRLAGVRFAAILPGAPRPRDVGAVSQRVRSLARVFYREPNLETAGALVEISLRHPNELVRVAAAASNVDLTTEPTPALRVLERGVRSRDPLTRGVAANALAHVDPRNPRLAPLLVGRRRRSSRRPSRTSLIVHGTWARAEAWWQPPAGDFWKYLHDNVDANLYGAQDRFDWSGGYSDAARSLGGGDLRAWGDAHHLQGLDVFAHSHGGSVAMLANHAGLTIGRLVLLSCPVHWPKYTPDFAAVTKVVSIHVHLDLVVLADRGGQRFNDARIEEIDFPVWFDHFATHDPAKWATYGLPGRL
jgi:hypothetical protein